MKILNNFLTSGHFFSKDESLQKFRFSFLNILMVFASIFTLLNSLASMFGAFGFGSVFENSTFLYARIQVPSASQVRLLTQPYDRSLIGLGFSSPVLFLVES